MIRMQNSILHGSHVGLAFGRGILRPVRGISIYLSLGIYGGGACLHSLHTMLSSGSSSKGGLNGECADTPHHNIYRDQDEYTNDLKLPHNASP